MPESCHYTVHVKALKDDMVLEIQNLQRDANRLEEEKDALWEKSRWLERIVSSLKVDAQRSEIIDQLKRGESYRDIAEWLGRVGAAGDELISPTTVEHGRSERDHLDLFDTQEPYSWTHVSRDGLLIENLLSLYFCWEYPVFTILSEHHFRNDMRHSRHQYCSSLLVNAILALACRFSDRPETRAISNDRRTAGDHFFEEAESLLAGDSTPGLTTLQALGIMSIREISCGRESKGWSLSGQCARMAIHLGLQLPCAAVDGIPISAAEIEVRAISFWGAFALDQAWSLFTGRIPLLPYSAIGVEKLESFKTAGVKTWAPYAEDNVRFGSIYLQPTNITAIFYGYIGLSEVINEGLYLLYSPGQRITSEKVQAIHVRYLEWYASLPHELRHGEDFTPAILVLHMYYQLAILLLFRPFFRLEFLASSNSPRATCTQAAVNITSLLGSYASLYSMRRVSFVVPHAVLASSAIHLANMSDVPVPKPLQSGLDALADMCLGDSFASSSLRLIKFIANEWGIPLIIVESSPPVRDGTASRYPAPHGHPLPPPPPFPPPDAIESPPSLVATLTWDWATTPSHLAYPPSMYSKIPPPTPPPPSAAELLSQRLTTDRLAGYFDATNLRLAGFGVVYENVSLYSRTRLPPIREALGSGLDMKAAERPSMATV